MNVFKSRQDNNNFEPFLEKCKVLFSKDKEKSYCYNLLLVPMEDDEDVYVFPIDENMKPSYELRPN